MLTATQIRDHALRFTEVLKPLVEFDETLPLMFGPFPNGGCRASSRLFGFYLADLSFPTSYVVGVHTSDPEKTHAWLQFDNSSGSGIIDLTCRQFDDCELQCPYVSETSEWHCQHWMIERREDVSNLTIGGIERDLLSQIQRQLNAQK